EQAEIIRQADKSIDLLESEVNNQAIRLIALRHPVAEDLRMVVAALKISADLERIGDYAKNIAKRTAVIAQSPPLGALTSLKRMGRLVQEMIKDVLDAYLDHNPDAALGVRVRDEEVDALHTSLFRELLTYMMEDQRNITPSTHLLFVAKNIERMGDLATNIAEQVYFMVEGVEPDEDRTKLDDTAYQKVETNEVP
ncbi:MAG: phosphate signaling complex protein PhoU, partial [Rhodospirillales bacterium]|nr:phosphate signaling complex protein PhoU [Rhodospirillales bacterium]